jgi:hypothetical protein
MEFTTKHQNWQASHWHWVTAKACCHWLYRNHGRFYGYSRAARLIPLDCTVRYGSLSPSTTLHSPSWKEKATKTWHFVSSFSHDPECYDCEGGAWQWGATLRWAEPAVNQGRPLTQPRVLIGAYLRHEAKSRKRRAGLWLSAGFTTREKGRERERCANGSCALLVSAMFCKKCVNFFTVFSLYGVHPTLSINRCRKKSFVWIPSWHRSWR